MEENNYFQNLAKRQIAAANEQGAASEAGAIPDEAPKPDEARVAEETFETSQDVAVETENVKEPKKEKKTKKEKQAKEKKVKEKKEKPIKEKSGKKSVLKIIFITIIILVVLSVGAVVALWQFTDFSPRATWNDFIGIFTSEDSENVYEEPPAHPWLAIDIVRDWEQSGVTITVEGTAVVLTQEIGPADDAAELIDTFVDELENRAAALQEYTNNSNASVIWRFTDFDGNLLAYREVS